MARRTARLALAWPALRPLLASALACALVVGGSGPALAQTIERSQPPQDAAPPSDDDDILAPIEDARAGAKSGPEKARKVGLVPLVPVGDAQKPLADQVTAGVMKELNESAFAVEQMGIAAAGGAPAAAGADAAKAALAEADQLLERARALLGKLAFGKAVKAFEAAIASYEKGAAALADVGPLVEAHVGLAEAYARQGLEQQAEEQLRRAATLNPEYELDQKKYPPLFIRTHQMVREKLMAEPKGSLFVDETAAGAEVTFDGRSIGTAPIRVTGVPQGAHAVRVVRPGQASYGAMVSVKGDAEATVSPGFLKKGAKDPLQLLAQNTFDAAAAKAVAEQARAAGYDAALVGVVGKKPSTVPLALVLVDAKSGSALKLPRMAFQGDLLDLSIELVKAKEKIEPALAGTAAFGSLPDEPLLEGVGGGAARVEEVAMRYEYKSAPKERRSRVTGEVVAEDRPAVTEPGDDGDQSRVLSAGGSGRRKSLRDDEGPFAGRRDARETFASPSERPLLEQPWFWPAVIGGGIAGAVVLGAVSTGALVGVGVIPDPRPTGGAEVDVLLPTAN